MSFNFLCYLQGPVGYTSVYEGVPALHQLERKNNADHDGHYEPIISAKDLQKAERCCHHRRLSKQPTTEQGHGVRGRNSCTALSRVQKSTMPQEGRRSRVQSEPRMSGRSRRATNFEHSQPVQEGSCHCCCSNVVIQAAEGNGATPDVDAYGFIQSGYPRGVSGHAAEIFSPQGRLVRSRSDETLSRHNGLPRHRHPSTRHQKTKAPYIDTSGDRYWTMSKAQSSERKVNRDQTYETLRSHPRSSFRARPDPRPYTYHDENDYVLPSALLSDRVEHTSRDFVARQGQLLSSNPASTAREQAEEAYQNSGEVFLVSGDCLNSSEIVFGPRSICSDVPSASKPGLPLSQSSPFVGEEQLSVTAEVLQSSPCTEPVPDSPCHPNTPAASPVCSACQHENFCSLQSTTNHPKADSGSNPDSGYGSKIYRTRVDPVMVFRPQDSNSSGKESKQSREDDKNSFGSSHWNTSECTVAPRLPNPDVVTKTNESRQAQPSRKTTTPRQQSFKEMTSPSRLPSANRESLSPQNLHHTSSKNRVVTGRCPSARPTSWCSHHQEPSPCRMENTFGSSQTHFRQPAKVCDAQYHQGTNRDSITESTAHSSNNLPRPAKPSKHRDRPTSYQQYEPIAATQNRRPTDQRVQQNYRISLCDQPDRLKYSQQNFERDACNTRQGNRQETPQHRDLHMVQQDELNATERHNAEFHRTESRQKQVYSPVEPSGVLHVQPHTSNYPLNRSNQMQSSVLEIGRSTMV